MSKPNKLKAIFGMGFKQYAQDADPEELAKMVMDEESDELEKEEASQNSEILSAIKTLTESVSALAGRIDALEKSDEEVHKEFGAEDVFKEIEGEEVEEEETMSKGLEAEDESTEEKEESVKMAVGDAAYTAAKKAIMGIADEKTRLEVAKSFRAAMDSSSGNSNQYGKIANAAIVNKQKAANDAKAKQEEQNLNDLAKKKYDEIGEKMRKRG